MLVVNGPDSKCQLINGAVQESVLVPETIH